MAVDRLMTIGQFSAMSGLSAKVLRTYAELGVLLPAAVDRGSGYRYYHVRQLEEAALVALLRRAGVPIADIAQFLVDPTSEELDGWERSLRAEVQARRDALAEVRFRLGMQSARTRGVTVIQIRAVEDRDELCGVFDLLGGEMAGPIDTSDFRFRDLDTRFPNDQPIMLVAISNGEPVGGALAFRNDDGYAVLRIIGVLEPYRHRGIGRRLVERLESAARGLGVEAIGLGTDDDPVGFYFHLGYTPHLLFQWVHDRDAYEDEVDTVLRGPLAGLTHCGRRSTTCHSSSLSWTSRVSTCETPCATWQRVPTWAS